MDMQTNMISRLGFHDESWTFVSWAFGPDGLLYGHDNDILYSYDLNKFDTTQLFTWTNFPAANSGMVFDKNGIAYMAGTTELFRLDISNKNIAMIGNLDHVIGDLTFRKGKLLGFSDLDSVVEISLKTPISSKLIFNFNTPNFLDYGASGMFSINHDCDSVDTYVVEYGFFFTPDIIFESRVFLLNFESKTFELVATTNMGLGDAATMSEFSSSDCQISIDLDHDNSSGVIDDDFDADYYCGYQIPLNDDDLLIRNDYNEPFDSIDIFAITPIPDGLMEEMIQTLPDSRFILSRINLNQWRILPVTPITNMDWTSFLKGIDYINYLDGSATQGIRKFDFMGYYANDTTHSIATINIRDKADAGPEQFIDVCRLGEPTDLKTKFASGTDLSGWFVPNYTFFDPQINKEDKLLYIVDDEGRKCYDTTTIHIVLQNSPDLSVKDTSVCSFPVLLRPQILSDYDSVRWDNNVKTVNRSISDIGSYTIEASYKGCVSEKTINVNFASPNEIVMPDTIEYCKGLSAIIDPLIKGPVDSLRWSSGSNEKKLVVSERGIEKLTIYYKDCVLSRSIVVEEDPCPKAAITFPNVFSPDYDGINDEFIPSFVNLEPIEFNIYDRWGSQVFSSDGKTGWDGSKKGKLSAPGVYVYTFKYLDLIKNVEVNIKGNVTLVR